MALVIRGKYAGIEFTVHQYCSNWVSSKDGVVYHISSVRFTTEEFKHIVDSKLIDSCFKPNFDKCRFILQ